MSSRRYGFQWENPEITSLSECHYYVAVEASGFTPKGEIGRRHFPSMTVAELPIAGPIDLELRALQHLYGTWLPKSSYLPAPYPAFEAWQTLPFADGPNHFRITCQLPVTRC